MESWLAGKCYISLCIDRARMKRDRANQCFEFVFDGLPNLSREEIDSLSPYEYLISSIACLHYCINVYEMFCNIVSVLSYVIIVEW